MPRLAAWLHACPMAMGERLVCLLLIRWRRNSHAVLHNSHTVPRPRNGHPKTPTFHRVLQAWTSSNQPLTAGVRWCSRSLHFHKQQTLGSIRGKVANRFASGLSLSASVSGLRSMDYPASFRITVSCMIRLCCRSWLRTDDVQLQVYYVT